MTNRVVNEFDNDFGFSAMKSLPEEQVKNDREEIIRALLELESLIMPLLENLRDSADAGDIIKWPNRKEILTKQIKKIEKITKVYKT